MNTRKFMITKILWLFIEKYINLFLIKIMKSLWINEYCVDACFMNWLSFDYLILNNENFIRIIR